MLSYNDNPCVKQTDGGYFRELQASDVRELFGLRASARLPNEHKVATYRGPRGDLKLYIAERHYPEVNQRILRPHRIFAICPRCGWSVPFGRMGQHWRRKDHG